jgi:hypothetical protein
MPSVLPPILYITPSLPRTSPSGQVQCSATGGSGSGRVWSLDTNRSGGSINASSGLYTAGSAKDVTDTVLVVDDQGNEATREIDVVDGTFTSLSALRTEAKKRCDLENSNFVSTAEWNSYLNAGASDLYDKLVSAYSNQYNVAPPFIFETDGVTDRYPLPPDFYKLLGVDVQVSNVRQGWLRVPRFKFGERAKFTTPYQLFYGILTSLAYMLDGNKLWVQPVPAGGQFLRVLYVPQCTRMVNDTDVLNGVNGWEEFVILSACVKALTKRKQDASMYAALAADMVSRITAMAEDRDAGSPSTVVDVRSDDEWGRY